MNKKILILAALIMAIVYSGISKANASSACDRECLKEFMTQYINAMLDKKPESMQLADNVRYTEDEKEIEIGDGYWKEISGTVNWRLDVVDVRAGGIGTIFVIKGSSLVCYGVRLKIVNNKISEIETIVVKNSTEGVLYSPQNFKSPDDSLMTNIPKPEILNTREEMVKIALKYPEAMKNKMKNFNANGLYFSKTAYRLENGVQMAGPNNIGTQGLPPLPGMKSMVAGVDEQSGIVLLRLNFGPGSISGGEFDIFEAFKIFNDSMRCVMAIMQKVPEGTPFGWTYDYSTANTTKSSFLSGNVNNGNRISVTEKGLSVQHALPCNKAVFEIYDITGKLILEKAVLGGHTTNALFFPIDRARLPIGRFVGCVKLINGGEISNSFLFPLNTIR